MVLPALKQLLQITKNIARNSYSKAEKPILQELNKNHDIIKQVRAVGREWFKQVRHICTGT